MQAYLINLDRSTERLAAAEAQLRTAQRVYERVSAVDGRALTFRERHRACSYGRYFVAHGCFPNKGQVGCTMSHTSVYRTMVEKQIPYALILEDDVKLFPEAMKRAIELVETVVKPENRTIWLLHNHHQTLPPEGGEGFVPMVLAHCMEAYVITLAAAQLLLEKNVPMVTMCDNFARWVKHGIDVEMVFPIAACQSGMTSDILGEIIVPRRTSWRWYVVLWEMRMAVFHAIDRFLFYLTGR
ncbi:MAG: glycosyltransferase family 25 protein [Kiritimatiellia bacterium]